MEITRNDLIAIGTSSTLIAQQNPNRKTITIRNTSDDVTKIITIVLGQQIVTANYGLPLNKGDAYQEQQQSGFDCFKGEIWGICAVAGGQVSIQERS